MIAPLAPMVISQPRRVLGRRMYLRPGQLGQQRQAAAQEADVQGYGGSVICTGGLLGLGDRGAERVASPAIAIAQENRDLFNLHPWRLTPQSPGP